MKTSQILKRMFIERYCVICGEPISYSVGEPFCEKCKKEWDSFLGIKCKRCGRDRFTCSCIPSKLEKINHSVISWSVFYDHVENGGINRLFLFLKYRYDRSVINLCAERMKRDLLVMCKNRGINYKEYAVTYAPRSRRNILRHGFDQSEVLAKSLALKLGVNFVEALKNAGNEEQKELNKLERAKNASKSYKFIKDSIKECTKLFLVDDILTSGATLGACSYLLYQNGAQMVVPVVFAKDNFNYKRS